MKKQLLFILLCTIISSSIWAQSISFTTVPTSTPVGTNMTINYTYTATGAGKIAVFIGKYGGTNAWDYISAVVYAETPAVVGTNKTGSFSVLIPGSTTPTANLTGNENYRIKIELLGASNNWLAGDYSPINYNFTANTVPAISITSIPSSTQAGTDLMVNYKYTSLAAGNKVSILVSKNGGINAYDFISTVAFVELNPVDVGTNNTGTITVPIPASTTPTADLDVNNKENYRVAVVLRDAANVFLAGDYSTVDYEITVGSAPYISVTSLPSSTKAGDNLLVGYKYTATSAGKVSVVVTKNGGANDYDFISTVAFVEVDIVAAGTNITGTFTVPIPADSTPTANLNMSNKENYRVALQLKDASTVFVAGDYSTLNYNITASLSANNFNLKDTKFSVFPNPVDRILTIADSTNFSDASYRILNISGQTVKQAAIQSNEGIDVSTLSSGLYLLSVDSKEGNKTIKFQKN